MKFMVWSKPNHFVNMTGLEIEESHAWHPKDARSRPTDFRGFLTWSKLITWGKFIVDDVDNWMVVVDNWLRKNCFWGVGLRALKDQLSVGL